MGRSNGNRRAANPGFTLRHGPAPRGGLSWTTPVIRRLPRSPVAIDGDPAPDGGPDIGHGALVILWTDGLLPRVRRRRASQPG